MAETCGHGGSRLRGERGEARRGAALPKPGVARAAAAAALPAPPSSSSSSMRQLALPRLLLLLGDERATLRQVVEATEVVEGEDVRGAVGLVGWAC